MSVPPVARGRFGEVILVGGSAPEPGWLRGLEELLSVHGIPVRWVADDAFGYSAETGYTAAEIRERVRRVLEGFWPSGSGGAVGDWVWIHNASLGRNVAMVGELARVCRARGVRVVWHHHDWWFDNRWVRWADMRRLGVRGLGAAARLTLPDGPGWVHAGINRSDVAHLRGGFGRRALWLPNPVEPACRAGKGGRSVRRQAGKAGADRDERGKGGAGAEGARSWLEEASGVPRGAPVWLLPCRFLRRKNMAEAVLLTRWVRPEGWLVTTAGPSSEDERPAWRRLMQAAEAGGWQVRLSVLAGAGAEAPSVSALMAASEAVVLTSIQEGFGLPYLEAASAGKALVGRRLGNVVPDLESLGFRFPTLYDELWVSSGWLDWPGEVERQRRVFSTWRGGLPRGWQGVLEPPRWLDSAWDGPVPFGRLSFTGQMEVLARPVGLTREAGLALNPELRRWAALAARGRLPVAAGEGDAPDRLSLEAYARRFWRGVASAGRAADGEEGVAHHAGARNGVVAGRVVEGFLKAALSQDRWYPLLWSPET